jgi:hypothetical protein
MLSWFVDIFDAPDGRIKNVSGAALLVTKAASCTPGIADDSSGRGTSQLEMQPQQPGSIAHLTENLAFYQSKIQPIDP